MPSKVNSEKSEIATEKDDSIDPVSSHDSVQEQQNDMLIDDPADLTEELELQKNLVIIKRSEKIGEGSYGVVYKGFNPKSGSSGLPNVVAIKVVQMADLVG